MELKVFSKLNDLMTSVPDHSLDEDSATSCQFVFCPGLDVTSRLPQDQPNIHTAHRIYYVHSVQTAQSACMV